MPVLCAAAFLNPTFRLYKKFRIFAADALYTDTSVRDVNDGLTSPNSKLESGTLSLAINSTFQS